MRHTFDRSSPIAQYATVPRAFVFIQRINLGLYALLGDLRATGNYRRIAEELWPFADGPPSTPLGEAEAAWLGHVGPDGRGAIGAGSVAPMRRRPLAPLAGSIALASPSRPAVATTRRLRPRRVGADTVSGDDHRDRARRPSPTTPSPTSRSCRRRPCRCPTSSSPTSIPTELVVTELTPGEGPAAAAGDTVFVNYVGVRSEDGTQFDNNYGGDPFPVDARRRRRHRRVGPGPRRRHGRQRLQLDIPTDLAYGDHAAWRR